MTQALDRYETLKLDSPAPGILVVSFNRPEVRNAISTKMGHEMVDLFTGINADPSGKRYLRATFEFEVNPPQGVEEMKAITFQVRDRIILVLTSKHCDDIRTTTGKGALREEILNELD